MRFAINSDSAMAQTWSGGSSGYAWHVPAFTPGVQPKVAVVPTMEDAFFVRSGAAVFLVRVAHRSRYRVAAGRLSAACFVPCFLAAILWHASSQS